ncbi:MAG: hypothetical protein M3Y91_12740 [Actinomycetota bacterium]|nr:hypothetical protein [Actinomycetota bacterium]
MATPPATAGNANKARTRRASTSKAAAAEEAVQENLTALHLPWVGDVSLPPADHLAWYAGVAALTAVELLDWPVALVLAVGKALADNRSHRTLRSLGEALEEAG